MSRCDEAAHARMARARAACACEPAAGIALCCPATRLPRVHLVVRGETVDVPHALPSAFACPRHIIMGW